MENNLNYSNEKNNKTTNVLLILVLIVGVILIGLLSYKMFIYDKKDNNQNKDKDVVNKDDNNQNDNKNNEDITFELANTAMETFKKIYISDDNLYSKDNYNISEISNYDLVATALNNINKSLIVSACTDKPREIVSYKVLNAALNEFNINKTITVDTIKSLEKESTDSQRYYVNNIGIVLKENGLELYGPCDSIFMGKDYVIKKIVGEKKDGEYLYVYEKQAFARYSNPSIIDSNFLVDYYKDYNKTILLEKNLDGVDIEFTDEKMLMEKNITPNWDLYNTYKYTFKIVDNKYYFERFELNDK